MNEGETLLKAILANREEDTPRLVYADWLQENGQEKRAEFIRLQCFAGEKPPIHHARHCERRGVSSSFLRTYGRSWPLDTTCRKCAAEAAIRILRDNPKFWVDWFDPYPVFDLQFHITRGFVSWVLCSSQTWRNYGTAILAAQPVEFLTLTDTPEPLVKIPVRTNPAAPIKRVEEPLVVFSDAKPSRFPNGPPVYRR